MSNNGYKLGDYLSDINFHKENILRKDPNAEVGYNPYVINMMLSYHPECLPIINELNIRPHLSKKMQYDFLISLITPKKRYAKHIKHNIEDDVQDIMDYYGYTEKKARNAARCMNRDHLKYIKTYIKTSKGGIQ